MDVIRSAHLEKYDWPETCHRERDAFRVKQKKISGKQLRNANYNHTFTKFY